VSRRRGGRHSPELPLESHTKFRDMRKIQDTIPFQEKRVMSRIFRIMSQEFPDAFDEGTLPENNALPAIPEGNGLDVRRVFLYSDSSTS
jgi:hypothetical protein